MFGTSGMRGTVGEGITCQRALATGRAMAAQGAGRVVVGRDCRDTGPMLADALSAGLREAGADVVRVGAVPTPTIVRGIDWYDAEAGVSVTASHNPPADNGLKLWAADGHAVGPERQAALAEQIRAGDAPLVDWTRVGSETRRRDAARRHVDAVAAAVDPVADLSVVLDAGNGVGGLTADALRAIGCEVRTLGARPDGRFPARPSEPTAEHCEDLAATVAATDADLGVAHDGDADRMMAVTADGTFLPGDDLLAVFAIETGAEAVAAPINTSLAVADALGAADAELIRTRVGDGYVARGALDADASFGGEVSGAWIWPDEVPCPDGPLAACRLASIVDRRGPLAELAARVPDYPTRRESVSVADKAAVLERVRADLDADPGHVDDRDGVRVATEDGWFLVRASGTQPLVRLTAEARDEDRASALLGRARTLVDDARDAPEDSPGQTR